MVFFSSRKAEDNESYQVAIGSGGRTKERPGVVQVIRSRFYGKKGKEREDPPFSFRSGASSAQALSTHVPVASSPLASSPNRVAGPGILRNYNDRPLPATPTSTKKRTTEPPSAAPHRPKDASGSSSHVRTHSTTSTSTSLRKNTDTVTVTLAQRLNELAMANSEGLLNDDEYRLLRQNLFERFASNAAVPTEAPVVPVAAAPRPPPAKGGATPERSASRPLSNFQVEVPRAMSINSRTSVTSGMTELFRRATGRASKDFSDSSSIWSGKSNTSLFRIPRILSKKSSDASVRTSASRAQADTISISSRRAGSDRGHGDTSMRSVTGSIRKMATPPSSFPLRALAQESRKANNVYNVSDEDHLTTVQAITQEILNVEGEARRLMDAFNGLEVTTLARVQRHRVRPSPRSTEFGKNRDAESNWGDSDGRSQRRINLADDAISTRSGMSVGTAPSIAASMARSAYSARKTTRSKGTLPSPTALNPNSRPTSLQRKNSLSSLTSERRLARTAMAPPMPALPNSISHGHLKGANTSNTSLARSTGHLLMNTVPEDENSMSLEPEDLEMEMEDIRRRREEVSQRYDARLEYLRAKLKGAQLHEKLMRK